MPQPSLAETAHPVDEAAGVTSFLIGAGIIPPGAQPDLEPLSGGVSSLIWLVSYGERSVVVKTPLLRLRVAGDWEAPLTRSDAEARWLETAASLVPGICPEALAYDAEKHLLALAYLDPSQHRVWKADLLAGHVEPAVAGELGARLGRLHRSSSGDPALPARFANEDLFRALRIAPYFESLVETHPDLAGRIDEVVGETLSTRTALVHGDVSPKNILIGPNGPVLLDAETAHWGDPAFDVAFCVNHLLLKCLLPDAPVPVLLQAAECLISRYLETSEADADLERRIARLLPLLMLARVDGRSPAEYLGPDEQTAIRSFARLFVLDPVDEFAAIAAAWKAEIA